MKYFNWPRLPTVSLRGRFLEVMAHERTGQAPATQATQATQANQLLILNTNVASAVIIIMVSVLPSTLLS